MNHLIDYLGNRAVETGTQGGLAAALLAAAMTQEQGSTVQIVLIVCAVACALVAMLKRDAGSPK